MARDFYANSANVAQLSTSVDSSPASITLSVNSLTGWPATPCWAEIDKGLATAEVVRVTNIAGTTLTVTRAADGLPSAAHSAGATVEHVAPAYVFNRVESHVDASTNVHGIPLTASVVGTSGEQTVEGKVFRGAHRASFSDTTPTTTGTASYESIADSGIARDGYVHRSTAGDVDRRGYLLQQSGTDRVQIFNDGTVDLAPGSSTRPGLRSRGSTQLDGAVTTGSTLTVGTNSSIAGNEAIAGTLGVTGLATFSGGTSTTTLTTSGNATIGGAATVASTLGVTGASTLTGNVSGGANITAAGGLFELGSTVPVMTTVATLGSVTSPVTGQIVLSLSDMGIYRREASAWVLIEYTNGGGFAYYKKEPDVFQSISTNTVTRTTFPTAVNTTADVTASGTNNQIFTINRAGLWNVEYSVDWQYVSQAGARMSWISNTGDTARVVAQSVHNSGATSSDPIALNMSTNVRYAVGDTVAAYGYQTSGVAVNTGHVSFWGACHLKLTWVRP